jgi:hypothetical protein
MNKEEVQKRVLKDGKPLSLGLFSWDEKTKTFSSTIEGLVIDFPDISHCTFNTGHHCTFYTSSYCTFNTGHHCTFYTSSDCMFNTGSFCTFNTSSFCTFDTDSDCIFNTRSDCTFNTSSFCTFKMGERCVIVMRDIFEVISSKEQVTLCHKDIPGYISNGIYSITNKPTIIN